MTVTRMATPSGPIPVTVDTFEALGGRGGGGGGGGGGGEGVGTRSACAYKTDMGVTRLITTRLGPSLSREKLLISSWSMEGSP